MSTALNQLVGAAYLVHFSLLMLQRGGLISLVFPNPLLKLFFFFFKLSSSHVFLLLHYRTQRYNTHLYLGCPSMFSNLPASREADSELMVDAQVLL